MGIENRVLLTPKAMEFCSGSNTTPCRFPTVDTCFVVIVVGLLVRDHTIYPLPIGIEIEYYLRTAVILEASIYSQLEAIVNATLDLEVPYSSTQGGGSGGGVRPWIRMLAKRLATWFMPGTMISLLAVLLKVSLVGEQLNSKATEADHSGDAH